MLLCADWQIERRRCVLGKCMRRDASNIVGEIYFIPYYTTMITRVYVDRMIIQKAQGILSSPQGRLLGINCTRNAQNSYLAQTYIISRKNR